MDWLFKTDEGIFHVRVGGILVKDGRLLAQNDGEAYAIPGGHLGFGETTEEALVREFREEMGMEVACQRLLWTEENFWHWGGRDAHNLNFYYLVQPVGDACLPRQGQAMWDHSSVSFHWLPVDELENVTIYPQFLKSEISRLDGPLKHFIRRD